MNPFDLAIDSLYTSILAEDVTYVQAGGGGYGSVRAIRKSPDIVATFDHQSVVSATLVLEVRVSEVPSPAAGDTLQLADGSLYVIQGEPRADRDRRTWTLDLRPA